jgi:hypothetical protein
MQPISVLLVDNNTAFLRIVIRLSQEESQNEVVVIGAVERGEEVYCHPDSDPQSRV